MSDLVRGDSREAGVDAGRGNLLGVQPFVRAADYASEAALSARLGQYLDLAAHRGWLGPRTIVVWPQYIGAWLIVAGEGPSVYQAGSLTGAMLRLVARHLPRFVGQAVAGREKDWIRASLLRVKAPNMARCYQVVFSGLALRYSVTTVAGSIVLPSPKIENGQVVAGAGLLYN